MYKHMDLIQRTLAPRIKARLGKGKVIVIVGARQVGKTTLTNELLKNYNPGKTLVLNGDNLEAQKLAKMEAGALEDLFSGHDCILIDEAHKVNRIGDIIKSQVDMHGKARQFILTGSSTVNLIDQTTEPLTGRKRVFELFPITVSELGYDQDKLALELPILLKYGLYPEVINEESSEHKQEALMELAESSLYRDVLDVTGTRASGDLVALLRYLAEHIGETLSINDISTKLSIDRRTIDRYIDLLTKSYVVFPLYPYSQREGTVRRSYKVYFWDVGIRNALAEDFTEVGVRGDMQALWQNFVIAERLKQAAYSGDVSSHYFWRSYDGAEVDLVEVRNQQVHGSRISWDGKYMRESPNFNKLSPKEIKTITPADFS